MTAVGFCGVLQRVAATDQCITLYFYPFDFSLDPTAKPILSLVCENPQFSIADLKLDAEYDIEVEATEIRLYDELGGDERTFKADAFKCSWLPYDANDYRQRVEQIEALERDTNDRLTKALKQKDGASRLITELTRRAQIKGEASDALKSREDAVVKALDQVLRRLNDD